MSSLRWNLEDLVVPELRKQVIRKLAEAYPSKPRTVRQLGNDELPTVQRSKPRNKFNAVPREIDGIKFDSQREARLYLECKARQQAGEITGLRTHVRFSLFDPGGKCRGEHIGTYRCDFLWFEGAQMIVADAKSEPTRKQRDWPRTKSLMKMCWGIEVKEL